MVAWKAVNLGAILALFLIMTSLLRLPKRAPVFEPKMSKEIRDQTICQAGQ